MNRPFNGHEQPDSVARQYPQQLKEKKEIASFFLWPGQALYIGTSPSSTFHQHHAIQIGIGPQEPLRIRYKPTEDYTTCQSFIVGPNTPHQIDAGDATSVFLWIESESVIAQALGRTYGKKGHPDIIDADRIGHLSAALAGIPTHPLDCSQAAFLFAMILREVAPDNFILPLVDPRIKTVIDLIKQSYFGDEPDSINHIAAQVYLSSSRLRHLFHDQFGISIQRYLLWQRLLNAIQRLAHGGVLTHVAHETGFADSSHMTRTFRMMFGVKPSEIFKNSHFVQVFACQVE